MLRVEQVEMKQKVHVYEYLDAQLCMCIHCLIVFFVCHAPPCVHVLSFCSFSYFYY